VAAVNFFRAEINEIRLEGQTAHLATGNKHVGGTAREELNEVAVENLKVKEPYSGSTKRATLMPLNSADEARFI
jgi:hypothetical protein